MNVVLKVKKKLLKGLFSPLAMLSGWWFKIIRGRNPKGDDRVYRFGEAGGEGGCHFFGRKHLLYLSPLPQGQGALRPAGAVRPGGMAAGRA